MERPHRMSIDAIVERQVGLWNATTRRRPLEGDEENGSVEEAIAPYIAISRQLGAGGNELARVLAKHLHHDLWDREIVDAIAERANVRVAAVKSLGETWYNRAHDWIAGTIDKRFLACDDYVRHLVEVVTALATHGPSIFLGRGVGFFLPPERGLRVRVVAPIEQRIHYMVERHGYSTNEAAKLVAQSDTSKKSFIRTYFRVDPSDPLSHDLCLNFGTLTIEQAVEICLVAFREKLGPFAAPATDQGG